MQMTSMSGFEYRGSGWGVHYATMIPSHLVTVFIENLHTQLRVALESEEAWVPGPNKTSYFVP